MKYFPLFILLVIFSFSTARAQNPAIAPVAKPFTLYFSFENNTAALLPVKHVGKIQYDAGAIGRGMKVEGSDYLLVADCPQLRSLPFTISAWVAPLSATSNGRIAEKGWSNSYWLRLNAGKANFGVWTGRYDEVMSGSLVKENEWTFICGVCDGESVKIYVNGELEAVQRIHKSPMFSEEPLAIGGKRNGVPDDNFAGLIDEFRYTNRALTDEEIEALYRK